MSCFAVSTAWAANTACNTESWNLGTTAPDGLVGSSGCEQVDKIFSNFSYTNGGTAPVLGSSVPVSFAGSTPLSPIDVEFGSNQTWDVNGAGVTTSAVASYTLATDPSFDTAGGSFYSITSLELQANVTLQEPAAPGDSATTFEYFCAGGASACSGGSPTTGGINLNAPTAGVIEITVTAAGGFTFGGCFNNGAATACTLTPSINVLNLNTSNYIQGFTSVYIATNLDVASGGDQVSLNDFAETFNENLETPEPATFGLMGAALAGLGFLGLRRRK